MSRIERRGRRFVGGVLAWLSCTVALAGETRTQTAPLADGLYAVITTPRGEITAELFYKKAPLAVMNFVGLAEGVFPADSRKPFFNGLTFHRVVPGFVVQGGDPAGRGDGGPGYTFPDEFMPGLSHDAAGVLSMANNGPDTNGSQFFLTLSAVTRLDYLHSVFGRVVRGVETLPLIQQGDSMTVRIERTGAEAREYRCDFQAFGERSHDVLLKATAATRALPEIFFADPDGLLPTEPPRAKAFNHKLAAFARTTGKKIFVQLLARMPSDPERAGLKPGAHAKALAEKFGASRDGVVVLYIAESDDWKLWIGDDLLPLLMGRPGTVQEFMRDGALHEKKEALLADAKKRLAAPADPAEPPAQRLKLACDDVLAALIAALTPSKNDE